MWQIKHNIKDTERMEQSSVMICHHHLFSSSIYTYKCLRGTTLISNITPLTHIHTHLEFENFERGVNEKILKMVMLLNRFFIKIVMGSDCWLCVYILVAFCQLGNKNLFIEFPFILYFMNMAGWWW